MSNNCEAPRWNLSHERPNQEQVEEEEGKRSFHVPAHKNHHSATNPLVLLSPYVSSNSNSSMRISSKQFLSQNKQKILLFHHLQTRKFLFSSPFMAKHGVTELTWQNGQLNLLHGVDGLHPTVSTKPTWSRANDTLESVVNQAKLQTQGPSLVQQGEPPVQTGRSSGKWVKRGNQEPATRKRTRSIIEYGGDHSVCGSASAALCRDNDTTLMTWASFDSACHLESENQEDEQDTKCGASRSHSARRSRTAAIHNQSERRRRDRINEKMKALQKLVPNASKTDKASMLDEVIEYLKQLQAQVQYMRVRSRQQMIMAIGMQQQQLQMSVLARMGMGVDLGMGMGMLDMSGMARTTPQSLPPLIHPTSVPATPPAFVPPHFLLPPAIPRQDPTEAKPATNDSADPFCAFLSQTMNMDMYNKMAAFFRQQVNQTTNAVNSPTQPNNVRGN